MARQSWGGDVGIVAGMPNAGDSGGGAPGGCCDAFGGASWLAAGGSRARADHEMTGGGGNTSERENGGESGWVGAGGGSGTSSGFGGASAGEGGIAYEPRPRSCAEALDREPLVGSGIFELDFDGRVVRTYCDMDRAGGGWTLFFAGRNGSINTFAEFENRLDTCVHPTKQCLIHISVDLPPSTEYAAYCGEDAIRFRAPVEVLYFFSSGINCGFQPLEDVIALSGNPNLSLARDFVDGRELAQSRVDYQRWR